MASRMVGNAAFPQVRYCRIGANDYGALSAVSGRFSEVEEVSAAAHLGVRPLSPSIKVIGYGVAARQLSGEVDQCLEEVRRVTRLLQCAAHPHGAGIHTKHRRVGNRDLLRLP